MTTVGPESLISSRSGLRLVLIFITGSFGAVAVYLLSGIFFPKGEVDFRTSSLGVLATTAAVAWATSFALTTPVAAALWRLVHKKKLDGFVSYSVAAIACASLISFVGARTEPTSLLVTMSVANAVLIRLMELVLGQRKE
jgi:hypothetical protein